MRGKAVSRGGNLRFLLNSGEKVFELFVMTVPKFLGIRIVLNVVKFRSHRFLRSLAVISSEKGLILFLGQLVRILVLLLGL